MSLAGPELTVALGCRTLRPQANNHHRLGGALADQTEDV
jgi:hypothetical protein